MFVSDDIISSPIFLNPRKPKKSRRRKLLLPRRKNTGPVDTVIQQITDEDGMLEDITVGSDRRPSLCPKESLQAGIRMNCCKM